MIGSAEGEGTAYKTLAGNLLHYLRRWPHESNNVLIDVNGRFGMVEVRDFGTDKKRVKDSSWFKFRFFSYLEVVTAALEEIKLFASLI